MIGPPGRRWVNNRSARGGGGPMELEHSLVTEKTNLGEYRKK